MYCILYENNTVWNEEKQEKEFDLRGLVREKNTKIDHKYQTLQDKLKIWNTF